MEKELVMDSIVKLPEVAAGQWLERPGSRLRFDVVGSGPPLVFVHGMAGQGLSWWRQLDEFAATHTCVTYSQRGFYPSETTEGELISDIGQLADDLIALIEHLDVGPVTVVAQSMGGFPAVDLAVKRSDLLQGLVLSCTGGAIDHVLLTQDTAWQPQAAKQQADLRSRGIHPAFGERGAVALPGLHQLYRASDELTPPSTKDSIRPHLARAMSPDVLLSVPVPMLFVTAAEDVIFPVDAVVALANHCSATLATAPEGGHSPYLEQPEFFNAALRDFLTANGI